MSLGLTNGLQAEGLNNSNVNEISSPQQEQVITVSGVVVDPDGLALPGVSVVSSNGNGTTSDFDGKFEIDVPVGGNITFSFIGMITQTVTVTSETTTVNISMEEDAKVLDDVVVTGYQTISKERVAGAYVKLDDEVLAQRPVANIEDALDGLVTGMTKKTGTNDYVVRGVGTFTGDTSPLVVIDGFMIQSDDAMSQVNPADVESMIVLKDAAATSIYGARAGNGVIVITTKKAKKGQTNVSYETFVSVSEKIDIDHALNIANTAATFEFMENVLA